MIYFFKLRAQIIKYYISDSNLLSLIYSYI
nr:MAG TPA: La domain [Caudoviricetes sp.]